MKKVTRGNITIEKVQKGYFVTVKDTMTENTWAVSEEELLDLEKAIHAVRGYEEFEKPL